MRLRASVRRMASRSIILDIGEEPVGYEDGFGALEVGVAGHDGFAARCGEVDEGRCAMR